MAMRNASKPVRNIFIVNLATTVFLFLAFWGALIPLFIVPQPVGPGRILAGIISIPIISTYFVASLVATIAWGLENSWARTYQYVFSSACLLLVPLGTIVHGIVLYYLSDERVVSHFKPEMISKEEEERRLRPAA